MRQCSSLLLLLLVSGVVYNSSTWNQNHVCCFPSELFHTRSRFSTATKYYGGPRAETVEPKIKNQLTVVRRDSDQPVGQCSKERWWWWWLATWSLARWMEYNKLIVHQAWCSTIACTMVATTTMFSFNIHMLRRRLALIERIIIVVCVAWLQRTECRLEQQQQWQSTEPATFGIFRIRRAFRIRISN